MLRVPHCLCQAMAWAFPMFIIDASEIAFSRGFQQSFQFHHLLGCCIIVLQCWDTVHRLPDCIPSLEVTRVFTFQTQEFFFQLFVPLAPLPVSFSTACVNDATFETVVRIWKPKRPCPLVSFGWIPPPLPCVMDSGSHIGWPLLIRPRTSHLLADRRLRSREIPFPPQDKSSTL